MRTSKLERHTNAQVGLDNQPESSRWPLAESHPLACDLEVRHRLFSPANPISGHRLLLTHDSPFPSLRETLEPVSVDIYGDPLFFCSAFYRGTVQPCKIGPHLSPYPHVPFDGQEMRPPGRYDLLPFDREAMVLVPAINGELPKGHIPVEGGFDVNGDKLYHAVGQHRQLRVPGKTGAHLEGCHLSYGGREFVVKRDYQILCWIT